MKIKSFSFLFFSASLFSVYLSNNQPSSKCYWLTPRLLPLYWSSLSKWWLHCQSWDEDACLITQDKEMVLRTHWHCAATIKNKKINTSSPIRNQLNIYKAHWNDKVAIKCNTCNTSNTRSGVEEWSPLSHPLVSVLFHCSLHYDTHSIHQRTSR